MKGREVFELPGSFQNRLLVRDLLDLLDPESRNLEDDPGGPSGHDPRRLPSNSWLVVREIFVAQGGRRIGRSIMWLEPYFRIFGSAREPIPEVEDGPAIVERGIPVDLMLQAKGLPNPEADSNAPEGRAIDRSPDLGLLPPENRPDLVVRKAYGPLLEKCFNHRSPSVPSGEGDFPRPRSDKLVFSSTMPSCKKLLLVFLCLFGCGYLEAWMDLSVFRHDFECVQ